ncbi:hypothetical protein NDA13_004524 [Ustilago tritici]|nr:hypothetical protein NDA13_004524 [Ustilago tritici]
MPTVHSNASHHHASNTGTAFAPAAGQTHVSDESTTPTTGHIQANDSSVNLTSDQESTGNPAPVPSTSQHGDGGDETMEDPYLVEPDQRAFQPIFTGRPVWSTTRSNKPIAPFEELPIPKSHHARVPPSLPCNYLALEILNIPQTNAPTATIHYVAQSLKTYAQVHDVWVHQVSYPNDPTPPANINVFITLISTPAGDKGGLDLVRLHAIPGYV